jgi:hypothetical protein
MTLGHLWMRHPERSLPYWPLALKPLFSMRPLARFLFGHPALDYALVALFYLSLYASLWGGVHARALLLSVSLFHLLCAVDLWRFLNSHQWLFCLTTLLVDETPEGRLFY